MKVDSVAVALDRMEKKCMETYKKKEKNDVAVTYSPVFIYFLFSAPSRSWQWAIARTFSHCSHPLYCENCGFVFVKSLRIVRVLDTHS